MRSVSRRYRMPLQALFLLCALSGCAHEQRLNSAQIAQRAQDQLLAMQTPAIEQPLTLAMALARAVKYNLETETARYQMLVAETAVETAAWRLLPSLNTGVTYSRRNNSPREQGDPRDLSREQAEAQAELRWSILDFGIGYIRKQQLRNDWLAERERYRVTLSRLMAETRKAYWAVRLSEAHQEQARELNHQALALDMQLQKMLRLEAQDPLLVLGFQRDLLQLRQQLEAIERWARESRIQLASLMRAATLDFVLPSLDVDPAPVASDALLSKAPLPLPSLEQMALYHRPELREADYQKQKQAWELRQAYWSWLPNLEVFGGYAYNNQADLEHNEWVRWGNSLTLDLLQALGTPARIREAQARLDQRQMQNAALAALVVKQVRLAALRLPTVQQAYLTTAAIADTTHAMAQIRDRRQRFAAADEIEILRTRMQALLAAVERDRRYLELMAAHEELLNAIGLGTEPETDPQQSLAELAHALEPYQIPPRLETLAQKLETHRVESLISSPHY